jgi:hypothetical protein
MESAGRNWDYRLKKMTVERKNILKKNKLGHLKIKNYKFKQVENFKHLRVILTEDNNHQTLLQERLNNAKKTYFRLQHFFKNKNISKKLQLILKNTIIHKTLTHASATSTLTNRDRKQLNIF